MTVDQMAAHVLHVATAHGVVVRSHSSGGRAWRLTRKVAIRPVRSSLTYAVALHELGHVLGARGRTRLDDEVQAWQWARENAQYWDDRMERERCRSLRGYVRWAQRRQRSDRHGRVFITPEHPVWRYVD
jgi:hypothetical protein